jgi:ADP-heptose:LPS heptosyltransferase
MRGRVGLGDQLMATGMAKGARERGKRIAFGDGRRIIWDHNSATIFQGNPNVAAPGTEGSSDLQWIRYYKGHRIYNFQANDRWIWNPEFKAIPGELFFDHQEKRNASRFGSGFILIEPNIESWKSVAPNKDWGRAKYQDLADRLIDDGYRVAQFIYPKSTNPLEGVERLRTLSFRDAVAVLGKASLYIGPEGGLHHGAAAMQRDAVVLFGGFIPPQVTGYDWHANLTGGAKACGSLSACRHCQEAMAAISVDEVYEAAKARL